MAVIIPCAGQSSRYPGTRPKFLLTIADGDCLFEKAARPYLGQTDVHFVILKEHAEKYDAEVAIKKAFEHRDDIFVHIIDAPTSGPAETVYIVAAELEEQPVFIQDCDSFFTAPLRKDNHVCTVDLRANQNVSNVAAKSFAIVNDQDILTNIVEKSVSSNYVCVGGYGFKSAKEYCAAYDHLQSINTQGETFVSHIIKEMLSDNVFTLNNVTEYTDLGTYVEFTEYNKQRPAIFCDLDGTVFYNQSKLFSNDYSNVPNPIPNAVKYLLKKQDEGASFIFTTSRPNKYRIITQTALEKCGFRDFRVLYDIPHAPRILINDTSKTNPYPSAAAINVPRDDNEFWSKM
jgi:hypothetical protein